MERENQTPGGAPASRPARRMRLGLVLGVVGILVLTGVLGRFMVTGGLFGGTKGQVAGIVREIKAEERANGSTLINRLRYSLPGPLDELIDWMFPRNWKGEYFYRDKLVELGTNCIPILIVTVERESSVSAKRICAGALADLRATEAALVLIKLLRADPVAEVRVAMAEALGQLAATNATPDLIQAMQSDQSEQVRGAGASALGELRLAATVPAVIAALQTEANNSAKVEMIDTLGKFRDARASPVLVETLRRVESSNEADVGTSMETRPYELYDLSEVRAHAADALGRIGGSTAADALIAALVDEEESSVVEAICRALGMIRDPRAIPVLRAHVAADGAGKLAALEGLGYMGDASVVPQILPLLDDRDKEVRARAAAALGRIGGTESNAKLRQLVEADSVAEVRGAACSALAMLGDADAQDVIARALPRLKNQQTDAIWALGHLGDTNSVAVLAGYLDDASSRENRFAAAYALAEIGGPAAVAALKGKLSDKDEYARQGKACAFAILGETGSLAAVRSGLQAENAWQRFGSAIALVRLGDLVQTDECNVLLHDREPALQRFSEAVLVGQGAMALVSMLQDEDETFRQYAARALVFFNDRASVPALRVACEDRDAQVREAARLTLQRLERNPEQRE